MRSMWLSRSLLPHKRLIFLDCGLHFYACPEGVKRIPVECLDVIQILSPPPIFLHQYNGFGGLGVSVLAFGTQVRGFKPSRSRRIFRGEKILSTPSFGGEVKLSVPRRRCAACKRSLELRGSRILGEICRNISRPRRVPPSATRCLSRHWT